MIITDILIKFVSKSMHDYVFFFRFIQSLHKTFSKNQTAGNIFVNNYVIKGGV